MIARADEEGSGRKNRRKNAINLTNYPLHIVFRATSYRLKEVSRNKDLPLPTCHLGRMVWRGNIF